MQGLIDDAELRRDFQVEAAEALAGIEQLVLELEATSQPGDENVNTIFRAVHSVKGSAGFLGLETSSPTISRMCSTSCAPAT